MLTTMLEGSCLRFCGLRVTFQIFLPRKMSGFADKLNPFLYTLMNAMGDDACSSSGVGDTRLTSLLSDRSVHWSLPLNHVHTASVFIKYLLPQTSKVPDRLSTGVVPWKDVVVNFAEKPSLLSRTCDVLSRISRGVGFFCAERGSAHKAMPISIKNSFFIFGNSNT